MEDSKKFIISFNGTEGSGKSTIAKMIAEDLGLPRYYMGQIFRDMAKEKGMALPEFRKLCDSDPSFDKKVDDYIVKLAKEQDRFVIESRTAWHFIPESIKIFLKVNPKVAAKRIFKELQEKNNRGNEDESLDSVKDIEKSIVRRRTEDSERYFALYGIRQDNEKNYDFILDTTGFNVEEVFERVKSYIKERSDS